MAQKRSKAVAGPAKRFPPEADGQFEVVPEAEIAAWREKLNARYGIGTGKLKVVDDPFATA
jgi:hypothetical protein